MRRIQYVTKEIIGDLGLTTTSKVQFGITLAIAFFVFWMRMVIHYLGQYVVLKLMDAPVIDFYLTFTKFELNYSYWSVMQEVAVVFFGCFSNTLMMLFFMYCCYIS